MLYETTQSIFRAPKNLIFFNICWPIVVTIKNAKHQRFVQAALQRLRQRAVSVVLQTILVRVQTLISVLCAAGTREEMGLTADI